MWSAVPACSRVSQQCINESSVFAVRATGCVRPGNGFQDLMVNAGKEFPYITLQHETILSSEHLVTVNGRVQRR